MVLSEQQFNRTRRLALSLAGIELVDRHRGLLERRGARLGVHTCEGMDALLGAAEKGDAAATEKILSLLTTKFTGFFRNPRQFQAAAEHCLRAVRERGRARLWSAGAATGEEPYSLAMALIEAFQTDDPPVEILASELDGSAMAFAQQGEYGELALRAMDPARRERFFLETTPGRRWQIIPALRRRVTFLPLNLVSRSWPVDGPFDVIFCRNVLMYLEAKGRCAVLERLASLLSRDGLLMLDPAEHTGAAGHLFTRAAEGVYSRRRAAPLRMHPGSNRGNHTSEDVV